MRENKDYRRECRLALEQREKKVNEGRKKRKKINSIFSAFI